MIHTFYEDFFSFHKLWVWQYSPRDGKNACVTVDSLDRKTRMFKNGGKKENSNLIDPYFAIFLALIKTFSSDLVSWEKQATKLASEHFLCCQRAVCRQGHCSCYKKVGWYLEERTRSVFENSAFLQMLCNWKKQNKIPFLSWRWERWKHENARRKCNCHCINAELNASIYTNTYAALSKERFFCNPEEK